MERKIKNNLIYTILFGGASVFGISRKYMFKFLLSVICLHSLFLSLTSFSQTSPFNKLQIEDTSTNYSFIVSGHFHGASTTASTFPAATLLSNIDALNSVHSSFLISLGDMFLDVDSNYIEHYNSSLFNKLEMPLFNVVGNHDLSNGNIYESIYGKSFFVFTKGTELFIGLNTELNDGSIKGEQLIFLQEGLQKASSDKIQNIFIFTHRPIWAEQLEKYNKLFLGNTRTEIGSNNFTSEILPLLNNISNKKKIYWMSGSMAGGPASFFYDYNKELNITFMQTAIRDLPRDAALVVNVNSGIISLNGLSFTGQQLKSIEEYNIDYWLKNVKPKEEFNYRLLPLLVFTILKHQFFWIGFFVATILIALICFLRKRKVHNSKNCS